MLRKRIDEISKISRNQPAPDWEWHTEAETFSPLMMLRDFTMLPMERAVCTFPHHRSLPN